MTNDADEPKLIIDEDYKSQVEREKREAQLKQAQSEAEPAEATETAAAPPEPVPDARQSAPAEEADQDLPPPPPATLHILVTSLATQAVAALGQLPDADGQTLPPNADYARHFIDLIGLLAEKTKGNLTGEEHDYLQGTLHQLRMLFVEFSKK